MKKYLITLFLTVPMAVMAQLGDTHIGATDYPHAKADAYYRAEKKVEGQNTYFEGKQYDRLILEGDEFLRHNQYRQAKASFMDARSLLVNNIQLPDTERIERLNKKIVLCDEQIAKGLDADDAKQKAKDARKAVNKAKKEKQKAKK